MLGRFTLSLLVFTAFGVSIHAQSPPTPKTAPPPQVRHESPQAVFEAYRQAIAKGDVRTEMSCMVREIREDAYQHYIEGSLAVACAPATSGKIAAVLKKYGADSFIPEYQKQYKAKYGVDPVKAAEDYGAKCQEAAAEYRRTHPNDPENSPGLIAAIDKLGPPPQYRPDEVLMRKVVNDMVADKFEFGVAIMDAAKKPDDRRDRYGPLKSVQIRGDTATGLVSTPTIGPIGPAGQPQPNLPQSFDSPIQFRKTSEGWLISGFGGFEGAAPRPVPGQIVTPAPPPRSPTRP